MRALADAQRERLEPERPLARRVKAEVDLAERGDEHRPLVLRPVGRPRPVGRRVLLVREAVSGDLDGAELPLLPRVLVDPEGARRVVELPVGQRPPQRLELRLRPGTYRTV